MPARPEIMDEAESLPVQTAPGELMVLDGSLAVELSRVEIDQQIATARRLPRHISRVAQNILSTVTLDEETAEECMYALPRGGKPIKGPSIRFAEVVKAFYGNCRAGSRVVHVDRAEKVVVAEGVFHDLESNTATRAEVRRRIVDSKGKLYTDDMIIVTGNAAGSIALRNAILGGVPKAVWRKAYDAVQRTIAGDITTLSVTREKAVKALATFGATPEQVFQAIGVEGVEDIKLEHIPVLRGMFAALKNGEGTFEEMFPKAGAAAAVINLGLSERLAARGEKGAGFNATHGKAEGEKPADEKTMSQALDQALDGDQVPAGDGDGAGADAQKSKAEIPDSAKSENQGAQLDENGNAPGAKAPLRQRIAAFKTLVDEAPTTTKALQVRADHKALFADVDRADPDDVGTSDDLEAYVNERCAEIESANG